MYELAKVYGPYQRPDLRYHVILRYPDDSRVTLSYPRYLMEVKLQRYLSEDEEIHHIDGNITNNSIDNLQILLGKTHRQQHTKYHSEYWICAYCDKLFEVSAKQVGERTRNLRCGRTIKGPYCSRSCNGKDNH